MESRRKGEACCDLSSERAALSHGKKSLSLPLIFPFIRSLSLSRFPSVFILLIISPDLFPHSLSICVSPSYLSLSLSLILPLHGTSSPFLPPSSRRRRTLHSSLFSRSLPRSLLYLYPSLSFSRYSLSISVSPSSCLSITNPSPFLCPLIRDGGGETTRSSLFPPSSLRRIVEKCYRGVSAENPIKRFLNFCTSCCTNFDLLCSYHEDKRSSSECELSVKSCVVDLVESNVAAFMNDLKWEISTFAFD